jgi:hypothetical protein
MILSVFPNKSLSICPARQTSAILKKSKIKLNL